MVSANCFTHLDPASFLSLVYEVAPEIFKVGDWVIVRCDNLKFPGEIIQIVGGDAKVSVMHHAKKRKWYWPTPQRRYSLQTDVNNGKIDPPVPVDLLGRIGVDDTDNILFEFGSKIR